MRHLFRLLAAAALFAAPVGAQSAGSVSVWLQLPATLDLAAANRVKSADALIFKLLGESAAKKIRVGQDGQAPLVHYNATSWSSTLSLEERRRTISILSQSWGADLRIELAASPFAAAPSQAVGPLRPPSLTAESVRGLLPPQLLNGDGQSRFYDRSPTAVASANPVFGGPSAASSRPLFAYTPPAPVAAASPVPPLSAVRITPYSDIIQQAARDSGIDPELLRAVVAAKSKYRAGLVSGGGYGLMAVSAASAKAYGYTTKDMLDAEKNVKVGSDILAGLLKQFDGDVQRALAAYQVGSLAVLRSGGIPNDKNVSDFLGAVALAQDPASRAAQLPVESIRSPLKFEVQKDLIELAQQGRNGTGVARWRPLIVLAAEKLGVDPHLMEAMVMQENTSGDPLAVSPAGALGLGQLMPATAVELGVTDPFDPVQNLDGMAKHMRRLNAVFDGDQVLLAAAYNAGEGAVGRFDRIPRYKQTMAYVRRVFDNYFTLTGNRVAYEHHMPPPLAPRKPQAKAASSAGARLLPSQPGPPESPVQ